MPTIAIVGAGQSGLQLAFALHRDGHEVTLYSDRTAEQMAASRLPSSNAMFSRNLDRERALDICLWDGEQPLIDYTFCRIADGPEGDLALSFDGRFARHAQSVDQRLKFGTWLNLFSDRGGKVVYGTVDVPTLESIAATADLTIISAGKGDITRLFEVNTAMLTYDRPQRSIGMAALVGCVHDAPDGVYYNIRPGVGEAFGIPMVTHAGPAIAWVMEAVPGGPMDRWGAATDPSSMLDLTKRVFSDFFPWENDRVRDAELADANAWLCGAVPPLVRKPIATLPSGAKVVGIADVVVLNDPCCGQGANNACMHADIVHRLITAAGDGPFDDAFLQSTFDEFWSYAQFPTGFTNTMLAPPPYALAVLGAATQIPEVAHRFCNVFDDPTDLPNFLADPATAEAFVAAAGARAGYAARGRTVAAVPAGVV
ncbi:styrene monooxygenase/indole monooxygenase family protein [Sporichthya polymorpha]|uniref:styrene monooxygenase/indole monooxygenase family protein n=1 Tax=Sporichthya polymorpha TaxID=35751 RepID=UPI00037C34CC|nr:styrene monooxygenase/indole monooxygenase family protein [Sporichthya polymorpha]